MALPGPTLSPVSYAAFLCKNGIPMVPDSIHALSCSWQVLPATQSSTPVAASVLRFADPELSLQFVLDMKTANLSFKAS